MTKLGADGESRSEEITRPATVHQGSGGTTAGESPWPSTAEDVATSLERALGLPPGAGRIAGTASDAPRGAPAAGGTTRRAGRWRRGEHGRDGASRQNGLAAGMALVALLGGAYAFVRGQSREPSQVESPSNAPSAGAAVDGAAVKGVAVAGVVVMGTAASRRKAATLMSSIPAPWRTVCREAPGLDSAALAAVSCTPRADGLAVVELRLFGDSEGVLSRYRELDPLAATAPSRGAPRCAAGRSEERAWATPSEPRRMAGRYTCRHEDGAAAMWWTLDGAGLLVHAVRGDGDLKSLFEWWRSDPTAQLG